MSRAARLLLAALIAVPLLAACGNKGPLVLPDQAPKKHNRAPATPPAPAPPTAGSDSGADAGQ
jgi:predicted small lipoprotein YifL